MSNRKLLLLPLALLLAGAVWLIFSVLQGGEGDVSLSGPGVPGALSRPQAGAALLPPADDAPRGPEELAGEVGDVAAPSALAGPQAKRGSVRGRLVNDAGDAVAGESAWLALEADAWEIEPREPRLPRVVSKGTSDADGSFSLPARAGVDYALHAGGKVYPVTQMPAVHAGDQLVVLLQHPLELRGVVLDEATGQPVAGARVLAMHDDTALVTDAQGDGSFRLAPLPSQDVVAGAWAPGYDCRLVGNLAPGAGPVTLELEAGKLLAGRLLDRVTDLPLAGGEVKLVFDIIGSRAGADPLPQALLGEERTASVDDQGRFLLQGVPSVGFTLECTSPGYLPESYERFEDHMLDAEEPVLIALDPAGAVTGTVRLATTGVTVAGAELLLVAPDGVQARGTSDAGGRFALLAQDAPLELLLSQPRWVEARLDDLGARARVGREREELELQLVPVLPLALVVLDGGVPVANAEVAARSKGAATSQAVTNAEGFASIVHAPAGPEVDRLVLQARYADLESLPLVLDPHDLPAGTITIDLSGGAWLQGLVTDLGGSPVPSVQVHARPVERDSTEPRRTGYSLADGRFRVGPLPAGIEYRLEISAEDYVEQDIEPVLPGGADVLVVLSPVLRWRGRVIDAGTGWALEDFWGQLRVEVVEGKSTRQRNTQEKMRLQSGAPGEFWFDLPGPGRYVLRLSARDYVTQTTAPFDFDGRVAPPFTDVALAQAAVLDVTVLDGRGRAVPGYAVSAIAWDKGKDAANPTAELRKQAATGRTDENGLVHLNLGAGGTFRIAGGPGLWFGDLPVTVMPGPPESRLYRLPPTGDLEVTVRDDEGQPLAGAVVEVRTSKDEKVHSVSRRLRTDLDSGGVVVLETLPPGDYDVMARRRNFESAQASLYVRANALEHVTLTLQPREPGEQAQGGPGGPDGPGGPGKPGLAGPPPPGPPR